MKLQFFVLTLLLFLIFPCISKASVEGKINEKFIDDFPRKVLVIIMAENKEEKEEGEKLIQVLKENNFEPVKAEGLLPCVENDYFYKSSTLAYSAPILKEHLCYPFDYISGDKLPDDAATMPAKFSDSVDGIFMMDVVVWQKTEKVTWQKHINLIGLMFGLGRPFSIKLFDIKSGEWVYRLEFDCKWLGHFPFDCDMPRYLNGDLKKKLKNVKFRQ